MSAAVTWTQLSPQTRPNFAVAGLVLAMHALAAWGFAHAPHPVAQIDAGAPLMVRFIEAPEPEPPTPEAETAPKVKAAPKPKPKPRVERLPEPVKRHEPVKKPLIAQTRGQPEMQTAAPKPKPQPQRKPMPQPAPEPSPAVSKPEPKPTPPASAPSASAAKKAAVVPPDVVAAYRNNPPPVYPIRSRRLGEQGRVLLRVHVTPGGRVDQIRVERSGGHQRLDEAALEAVRDWRFAPARRGNRPIAAWVLVPIHFKLS